MGGSSGGVIGLARRVRRKLPKRLDDQVVIAKDLTADDAPPSAPRLRVAELTPELAPALRAFIADGLGAKQLPPWARLSEWSLKLNYAGFVVYEGSELIGFAWFVPHDHPLRARHPHLSRFGIELQPGECYMYQLTLDARWRGKGRATEFVRHLHARLFTAGYRRIWGYVLADNLPARLLYRGTGWRDVRRQRMWRVLGPLFLCDGRLFVSNSRRGEPPFDYRAVY